MLHQDRVHLVGVASCSDLYNSWFTHSNSIQISSSSLIPHFLSIIQIYFYYNLFIFLFNIKHLNMICDVHSPLLVIELSS